MSEPTKTLGQVAYEAYLKSLRLEYIKPGWFGLIPACRVAWETAARAVQIRIEEEKKCDR